MQECVLPTISIDTIGSSVYSRISFRYVFAAFSKALLISSIVTVSFTLNVMSVNEPFATGTLIPHPPMASDNSGKIFVRAFAAPVVVGTIDCPAALARRKSLCG